MAGWWPNLVVTDLVATTNYTPGSHLARQEKGVAFRCVTSFCGKSRRTVLFSTFFGDAHFFTPLCR
jgi:hypothetical protein